MHGTTLLSSAESHYHLGFQQDKHHRAFVCYLLPFYNFIQHRLGPDIANILACSIPDRWS